MKLTEIRTEIGTETLIQNSYNRMQGCGNLEGILF